MPVTHISVQGDTVTLELPMRLLEDAIHAKRREDRTQVQWDIIEGLYGVWRSKGIDGLAYERKLRDEWKERL